MSAYPIVTTRVVQHHGWGPNQSQVGSCFDRQGGKYLVMRSTPDVVEGVFPQDRLTMFEFPSLDVIHALWDSEEYRGISRLHEGLGELYVWAVAGTEDAA